MSHSASDGQAGGGGSGDEPQQLRVLAGRRGSASSALSGSAQQLQVLEASQHLYVASPRGSGGSLAQQFEAHEAAYDAAQLQQQTMAAARFVVDPERGGAASSKVGAATPPLTPAATRRNSRIALLSMLLLVFQGTALSIMLRYSRARAGQPYLASVSVIFTEFIKLVICLVMQYSAVAAEVAANFAPTKANGGSSHLHGHGHGGQQHGGGAAGSAATAAARAAEAKEALARELRRQARDIVSKAWPMLLPAGMFVMQQVLLIIAATHLDAVAFQIFSQSFKLVPTALFAYWLLGQMLEPMQWASIPVLAVGVVLVTVNNGGTQLHGHRSAAAVAAMSHSHGLDYVAGMVACSISGLSSAYAGVYFEKYVKGRHAASLWVRNIQLGLFGVPLSTGYALLKDGWRIHTGGLMQGFDASTWTVIALQVFGGLVTGMVVKYCDNILKNFALAISVILTVLVAIPLFGQWPSPIFLVGVGLVLLSVFMYGRALDARRLQQLWQRTRKRMQDGGPGQRWVVLLLLTALAAGCVLLLAGGLSTRRPVEGLPLTQGGMGSGQLTASELLLDQAAGSRTGRQEGAGGGALARGGGGQRKGGGQQRQQQRGGGAAQRQGVQRQQPRL
ncbi:UDP-N-acetylglucosamine transporter-like [Micractinium conductrix]|uniref:UDP-N-acetylglucosamine transporter-like n=1 Tax=Micractinium conductrix TaxID=554055 RepID=A0A2P6V3T6_9CHLO|nr:UDP-N-acetylglucosamine transporter-like [Micractinium conductrix]|eukprot:PSC68753.1 UDP-N-acetylglucosamine transporter-like [Micractinium conductrix]